MTPGFRDRLGPATAHEGAVLERIQARGWVACRFGQGLLTADVQAALIRVPDAGPLRRFPDLLAIDPGVRAVLVDAKTGRADTANYDLEAAVLADHHRWFLLGASTIELVYVWHDLRVSTHAELRWLLTRGRLLAGPHRGNGSGQPYWLIPKHLTGRDFADYFTDRGTR